MLLTKLDGYLLVFAGGREKEPVPIGSELPAQAEETRQRDVTVMHNLLEVVQRFHELIIHRIFERSSVLRLPRGIAQMDDHVGDGVVVERSERRGKVKLPAADDAGPLEWQITRIVEVKFKSAAVLVGRAGGDGSL